jgi:hypothetical protein
MDAEKTPQQLAEMLGLKLGDGTGGKFVRPMGVPNPLSARERATARGWKVDCDPDAAEAHPHDGPCNCKEQKTTGLLRWCPCSCHGLGGPREKE